MNSNSAASPTLRLRGKAAIITGAASGIGRATAERFAAEGAALGLIDRHESALQALAGELRQGVRAVSAVVDLTDSISAEHAVTQLATELGGCDILINNAAIATASPALEMTTAEWNRVLAVNLTAYFVAARAAAARMKAGGSIVQIASVHRLISEPGAAAYAASKGAVAQLTRSLAIEFAARDIAVNSISPGFVRTAMSIVDGVDETTTERFLSYYVKSGRIPLGRAGRADEIAAAALFLASRECGYLTGADIVVDGGLTTTL